MLFNYINKKASSDNTTTGFAPGELKSGRYALDNSVRQDGSSVVDVPDKNIISYKPYRSDKKYWYSKLNIPMWRNQVKNIELLNKMRRTGRYSAALIDNALTGDKQYTMNLRKHYASIPDTEWNRVFMPMTPTERLAIPDTQGTLLMGHADDAYRPDGTIEQRKRTYNAIKARAAVINQLHIDERYLAAISDESLAHEVDHAKQLNSAAKNGLMLKYQDNYGIPTKIDKAVSIPSLQLYPTLFKNAPKYAYNNAEVARATATFNKAVYGLNRLLWQQDAAVNPVGQWSQFDRNKLLTIMDFKGLPKNKDEYIRRIKFFADNPEMAFLLGPEAARSVSMWKDRDMRANGYGDVNEETGGWRKVVPGGHTQPAVKQKKDHDAFWFLGKNQKYKNNNTLSSAYA